MVYNEEIQILNFLSRELFMKWEIIQRLLLFDRKV